MAAQQAKRGAAASTSAIAHERWTWILSALVGQHVTATVKDGMRVKGILSAATPEGGDLSISIRQAVTLSSPPSSSSSPSTPASESATTAAAPKPLLVIQGRDLVQLEAADAQIDLTGALASSRAQSPGGAAHASSSSTDRDSFRTDTDISRATQLGKERQLQAWGAQSFLGDSSGGGIEDDAGALEGGLEDSSRGSSNGFATKGRASRGGPSGGGGPNGGAGAGAGGWDQFAANERAFGLRTDYDDEIYTTRLDRSTADFKQREARAAQLEREILKGSTSSALAHNAHVAEERGEQMPDLNEEERYGAVIRELPPATEGAYVPPGARKAALARLQSQNGGTSAAATSGPASGTSATPNAATLVDPAIVGTSSSSTPLASSSSSSSTPAPAAGAATNSTTSSKPNPNAKPYDRSMQEFVTAERVRLEQKRNQMQQAQQHSQHQAQIKKEHDSKLASLLQWSQTFKNPYPMPDDVAELLRKKPAAASTAAGTAAAAAAGKTPAANGDAKSASTTVSPASGPKPLPTLASSVKPPSSQPVKITKPIVLEIPPFDPNRAKAKQAALAAQKAGGAGATAAQADVASPSSAASTSTSGATAAATKKLSATSAAFVFKPNPAAASFTPGASTSARRPSATSATSTTASAAPAPAAAPEPPKAPANPFFGTKQIKKGSSSMHVKEDFTPFKNGVLPEPSTVPPAWSFTGKSYRSIYPIPPQGPLDDGSGGMMDPNGPAAMAAAQAAAAAAAAAQQAAAQQQAQAAHAHALAAAGMPINMLPGPPPPMMAMSAGGGISGSPASMPPPLPPQGAHMHPHHQQQPPQMQPHFAGMYAHHPHHPGHAPAFNPAAMGFAPRPGGGGGMPQMNAAGPGPQFQPHHMQQHGGSGGGNGQQGPQYFGQPGGPPQQMHGFVPGGGNGGPPHGAQMLSSPHMPQSTTHSPRVAGPNHQGGRGSQGSQQQQQPMPWTPPQFVPGGGPNGGPHGQGQGGYPQQQQQQQQQPPPQQPVQQS